MEDRLRSLRIVGVALVWIGFIAILWEAGNRGSDVLPYGGLSYGAVGLLLLLVHRFIAGAAEDATPLARRIDALLLTVAGLAVAQLLWGVLADRRDDVMFAFGSLIGVALLWLLTTRRRRLPGRTDPSP